MRLRRRPPTSTTLRFVFERGGSRYVDHEGRERALAAGREALNAYRGKKIVGSLMYLPPQMYVPEPQIETLWIAPDHRGTTLLLTLVRHALGSFNPFPMKSHIDDPRLARLYRIARARHERHSTTAGAQVAA